MRDVLELREDTNQSVPSCRRYNAKLSGERQLTRREDARAELNSPGIHMSSRSALAHFSASLYRGPSLSGPVGWLVEQLLPLGHPGLSHSLRE